MSVGVARVLIAAAAGLWLTGCDTTKNAQNPALPASDKTETLFSSAPAPIPAPAPDATGSVPEPPPPAAPPPPGAPPPPPGVVVAAVPPPRIGPPGINTLFGKNPADELNKAKKYFRAGQYGNAETHFRRAVEYAPQDAEAWLGLAASYDRLKRFDLADRAYYHAIQIIGPTPVVLNNQGFSYMLRGDYLRARAKLTQALDLDPTNPYIQNNIDALEKSMRGDGGRKKL
jgi:tetratricopeptide (TPR) repeat protein